MSARRTKADLLATPENAPWDIPIFAAKVGASATTVRRWIVQGRLRTVEEEIAPGRTVTLVLDRERPPRVAPGALSLEAREATRRFKGLAPAASPQKPRRGRPSTKRRR